MLPHLLRLAYKFSGAELQLLRKGLGETEAAVEISKQKVV